MTDELKTISLMKKSLSSKRVETFMRSILRFIAAFFTANITSNLIVSIADLAL